MQSFIGRQKCTMSRSVRPKIFYFTILTLFGNSTLCLSILRLSHQMLNRVIFSFELHWTQCVQHSVRSTKILSNSKHCHCSDNSRPKKFLYFHGVYYIAIECICHLDDSRIAHFNISRHILNEGTKFIAKKKARQIHRTVCEFCIF